MTEQIGRVESLLQAGNVLNGALLDVATFGMPIRYGWDPTGIGKLLHLVNHRPMRTDGKRWLAKMELPQVTMEMPIAWGGDYVQQLATAVTDGTTVSACWWTTRTRPARPIRATISTATQPIRA
nr:hypothetical protein [Nitrospirota bacterium]